MPQSFMHLIFRLFAMVIVALCLVACPLPLGDVWIHFEGIIRNTHGNPLQRAVVTVVLEEDSTSQVSDTSSANGTYRLHIFSAPFEFPVTLKITKTGYQTYHREVPNSLICRLKRLDIILEKVTSEKHSRAANVDPLDSRW